MQSIARKQDWPLDRMCLVVEVTKKQKEEIHSSPKDGVYIHKYKKFFCSLTTSRNTPTLVEII